MITEFVMRFDAKREALLQKFRAAHPENYRALVRTVIEAITTDEYGRYAPDPTRIVEIDHGREQGTLLFVIGEKGYQPNQYYAVAIYYGSCAGCDALERILDYGDNCQTPTEEQAKQYLTLALHVVQRLKDIGGAE